MVKQKYSTEVNITTEQPNLRLNLIFFYIRDPWIIFQEDQLNKVNRLLVNIFWFLSNQNENMLKIIFFDPCSAVHV